MADPVEEIEVVLEPEAGQQTEQDPKVEVVTKAEEKPQEPPKAVEPEEGIQALKGKLEQERQARAQAERNAREAEAQARRATEETQGSNLALVTNAIELVKQSGEVLEGRYAEAAAAGDWAAAGKIQREMASNEAKLLQLEQGKQALEAAPKQPARVERTNDPVEDLARQLSPRSAAWIRAHPEYAQDQRLYRRMIAAHNLAETDGIAVDTDDYFASIESTLGLRQPQTEVVRADDPTAHAAQPARRQAPPAAPVSRSGDPVNPRPNTVRLTPEEVEMARAMEMTPEAYARQKMALIKEGKLH